ncbi:MAG TPA: hypothetical protein VG838_10265 [Opitutaceae bacterium]|nr:hypothetical protein [Opitutaceae bacterium]
MPADDPDPPRKFYDFKSREIESVNAPTNEPQAIPAIDVHQLLRQANSAKPGGVAPTAPPAAPVPGANDVHATLRENVARANAFGLNELKPIEKRPSRRKRDFLFLVITSNVGFGLIALLMGGLSNPIVFVSAIAGIALVNVSLGWVMFFIMDDY